MKTEKRSTNLSEKEKQLVKKLISIWKDEEFVLGVICTLRNDKEVQQMLDYIDSDEEITPSDITVKALYISKERRDEELVTDGFYNDLRILSESIK